MVEFKENIKEIYDKNVIKEEMTKKVKMLKPLDLKLKGLAILKNYEKKTELDKEFHKEMMNLIMKYEELSLPIYNRVKYMIEKLLIYGETKELRSLCGIFFSMHKFYIRLTK